MAKLVRVLPTLFFLFINLGLSTCTAWQIPLLPGIAVAWIFHWALYQPTQLDAFPLVAIGLIYDLILGNPTGFTPLLYLVTYLSILYIRPSIYSLPFLPIWGIFCILIFLYVLAYWGVSSLLAWQLISPLQALLSLFLSFFLYPFLSRGMIFIQRHCHG